MRCTFIVYCITIFLFSGCSNTDSSSDNKSFDSSIVSKTNGEKSGVISTDSAAPLQTVQNGIQTMPVQATTPVITTGTTATTQTAAGMNPAHGQPGHRCDIAVGAPLNSAPAKPATAATPVTNQPVITSTTAAPAPTTTAPGMNPPHGQPGHKCEIAVGAPLNSAPAKTIVPKSETITKSADAAPAGIELPAMKAANDSSRKQ